MCRKLRALIGPDLLDDAFVMHKERWFKQGGAWSTRRIQMFKGYFFVATRDVAGLQKALSALSFPVRIAGSEAHAAAPLDLRAQAWFEGAMDGDRTLKSSTAVIVDGVLHVQTGPLVGQESRVRKIDRHRRSCVVDVCPGEDGFSELMPIDVPFKS